MLSRLTAVLALASVMFSAQAANFVDFPVQHIYTGRPAPADFATPLDSNRFKKRLAKAAAEGPNFAGAYTVVHWECGWHCEVLAILSAETGRVKKVLSTCGAHAYRLYSNLLIVNPADAGQSYPASCQTEFYVWKGSDLEKLPSR